jgi:hypothetical protein
MDYPFNSTSQKKQRERRKVDEYAQKETLLRLAGNTLNAMLDGISQTDDDTIEKVMWLRGETCAKESIWGPALDIAERISREEKDLDRIIEQVDNEIPWCGKWSLESDTITTKCTKCGCPLAGYGVVRNTEIFYYCSKGWVETIFSMLFNKPVMVKLEKAISRRDDECKFKICLESDLQ